MKNRKAIGNFVVIGLALIILISFVFLVSALTSDERQSLNDELNNLTSDLNSQGYSWLIDYSINYPFVEVFRKDDNNSIAKFENVSSEGWYKIYLTNLSENETRDIFDLKIIGGKGGRISQNIFQKKMRIDEIRKELNHEGGNV